MPEIDPNGMAAHTPGAKLDAGKAPISQGVLQYFPRALREVSLVSLAGARKYAWKGWEKVPDGVSRYSDALGRHLLAEEIDGPIDADTGMLHAAQIAWNALARLELMLRARELNETQVAAGKVAVNDVIQVAKERPKPGELIPMSHEEMKAFIHGQKP